MKSTCGRIEFWNIRLRFKFSSVMSAKKDRLFCSIADLRDLEDETSTVFEVYSNDKRIKFRIYVFCLCYPIAPEYSMRLLINKLS